MGDVLDGADSVELARRIRDGEVTPREVTEATLARIEALDPDVNAVIHRADERALEEASSDLPDGPFRGVPMLVKDLWPSTAGEPMHLGIKGLADAGYVAEQDSHVVQRYREAGFVMVGRTNTPELGTVGTTEPLAHGPTRNPWDLSRSAGGSSGGAAAAVAAGMVPAANASDGGGSIRIPASACGLVGLKPSRGRISMGPSQDDGGLSVQHVVSHTVRDTAAILDVSYPPFLGQGVVAPLPSRPYADEVGADPGRLRIGLWLDHPRFEPEADCREAALVLARTLESMGHEVTEAHPAAVDDLEGMADDFTTIWLTNAHRNVIVAGELIGRELTEADVEPSTWLMVQGAAMVTGPRLAQAQGALATFRHAVTSWWSDFDLLLSPTTAMVTPPLGSLVSTDDDPLRPLNRSGPLAAYTSIFNATGQPAISLPAHRTADGLPVGAHLVAAYGREDLLIRVAAAAEDELRWSDVRAPMHP